MNDIRLEDLFQKDNCDLCGLCLEKCPELGEKILNGGDIIKRLIDGEYISEVLEKCTNCMTCNSICPQEARPYELIIYRWFERYKDKGIPPLFLGAVPFRDPSAWTKLGRWYTPREQEEVKNWRNPQEAKEMLYLGCNQQYTPYIVHSRLFEDLPIFCDRYYCCGEPVFRLGMLEQARKAAFKLKDRLNELKVERLITFCPSCYNTMTNLTPNAFGIDYGIEIVDISRWLKERLKNGNLEISNPLGMSINIQDGCHGTEIGTDFLRANRDICESIGLTIREMEYSNDRMRCCGLGASVSRYNLRDVVTHGIRRLRESRSTDVDATCAYCNGCYFIMNMVKLVYPFAPPVYHLVELVQMAMGETPERRISRRRIEILLAATESVGKDLFKIKRVHMD